LQHHAPASGALDGEDTLRGLPLSLLKTNLAQLLATHAAKRGPI
jgi:hypothetical protein